MNKSLKILSTCGLVVGLLAAPVAANAAAAPAAPSGPTATAATATAATAAVTVDLVNRSETRASFLVTRTDESVRKVVLTQNGRFVGQIDFTAGVSSRIHTLLVNEGSTTVDFAVGGENVATIDVPSADAVRLDAPDLDWTTSPDGHAVLTATFGAKGSISVTNAAGVEVGGTGIDKDAPLAVHFWGSVTPGETLTVTGRTAGGSISESTTTTAMDVEIEIPGRG